MLVRAAVLAGAVLLAAGCDDDQPAPSPARDAALIEAAAAGRLDEVDRLLGDGADVTATDAAGRTALVAAAYGNHVEVAARLVDAGADVDTQDDSQQSAFLIATSEVGDDPRLLELEAVILGDGNPDHTEVVRLLVEEGDADVTIADDEGVTALEHARAKGQRSIVAILERVALTAPFRPGRERASSTAWAVCAPSEDSRSR